jgi:hypothetical protein
MNWINQPSGLILGTTSHQITVYEVETWQAAAINFNL